MADIKLRLLRGPASAIHDPITGVIWITIAMLLFAGLAVTMPLRGTAARMSFENSSSRAAA